MDVISRNNVKVFGHGSQPMVFAHGFGCGQHMWRYIWPAFENDYKIVLFDYVGSGGSDALAYNTERYDSLHGYVQDLLDVCHELGLSKCIFVGHSVSCMVGVLASVKAPELFDSLILIGPSARYIDDEKYTGGFKQTDIEELLEMMEKNYIGWSNFLGPAIMQNQERPELGAELTESFCSTDPKIAKQFARVTFLSDNRKDLVNVRHPVLILQCSEDIIAPVQVGEFLHRQISNSEYKLMQATGHCPHLSAPGETIELMSEFLTNNPWK
ncbi:alpha/beta fold hydrolase [Dyadobacter sp. CY326]|uniref:alpha/beta fold hydrolase n=1 Tax=Dyadobacter sp. CY326 TaxID=2907300 RepID=UPI001F1A1F64|nr:alpha/beta hydrolase [Dyadobacter sp. CY326]MCE7067083.1 alpha/beta hydrolase [Dyadobacter sp. CY326]